MTTTVIAMTETEARDVVRRINEHLGNLRALLLDLYNRKGWQALGYSSWRECVNEEFAYEETYLYRLLNAATVEVTLDLPIGKTPESQLRPLTSLEPEQQKTVWQVMDLAAKELGVPQSTSLVKSVVSVIKSGVLTETLDGEITLTEAAKNVVVEEYYERKERQKSHIAENKPKPMIFEAWYICGRGFIPDGAMPDELEYDKKYRLVIYEVQS